MDDLREAVDAMQGSWVNPFGIRGPQPAIVLDIAGDSVTGSGGQWEVDVRPKVYPVKAELHQEGPSWDDSWRITMDGRVRYCNVDEWGGTPTGDSPHAGEVFPLLKHTIEKNDGLEIGSTISVDAANNHGSGYSYHKWTIRVEYSDGSMRSATCGSNCPEANEAHGYTLPMYRPNGSFVVPAP